MISIIIFYSCDRLTQLQQTMACLEDMQGIDNCEKIIVSDGPANIRPAGYLVVEVTRPGKHYCWAKVWECGVKTASCEKVLYIDSDRILPTNALDLFDIRDEVFVFPKYLFSLTEDVDLIHLKTIRDNPYAYLESLRADHREYSSAYEAVCYKNPMSGCVGFTKKTFWATGGLDKHYVGYGYPDTDYFMKTLTQGCRFDAIEITELHLHHGYSIGVRSTRLMNLWNGALFCRKWNIKLHPRLQEFALKLGVDRSDLDKYDLDHFLSFYNTKFLI